MFCVLHYYYCIFQENELSTGNDLVWVKEAARLASLASFLQPPACKLEILLNHRKEQVFTQVLYQPANRSTCVLHILVLLGLIEATDSGTWRDLHTEQLLAEMGFDPHLQHYLLIARNKGPLTRAVMFFTHSSLQRETPFETDQIKVNNEYFLKEACR